MSLKQECIDFMKLIIEPLQNEIGHYELKENSYGTFCALGEELFYCDCMLCERFKNEFEYDPDIYCPDRRTRIKVDVYFWDGGCVDRHYIFESDGEERFKGATYIDSHEQLMEEMVLFKKELEKYYTNLQELKAQFDK